MKLPIDLLPLISLFRLSSTMPHTSLSSRDINQIPVPPGCESNPDPLLINLDVQDIGTPLKIVVKNLGDDCIFPLVDQGIVLDAFITGFTVVNILPVGSDIQVTGKFCQFFGPGYEKERTRFQVGMTPRSNSAGGAFFNPGPGKVVAVRCGWRDQLTDLLY
ncbi:hypothetical protein BJ875DRAFT_475149 [Amylocarpus encephaloides]|uniref:Uncharacterized protein n=1 Tax=Amylocarpus encephaloides TaxID=45428 RepID=A0A9P7Y933_9HELO|nr:hypothetical protein BJ875DRAFT_475149 [Amylocarpus encephaloides]